MDGHRSAAPALRRRRWRLGALKKPPIIPRVHQVKMVLDALGAFAKTPEGLNKQSLYLDFLAKHKENINHAIVAKFPLACSDGNVDADTKLK